MHAATATDAAFITATVPVGSGYGYVSVSSGNVTSTNTTANAFHYAIDVYHVTDQGTIFGQPPTSYDYAPTGIISPDPAHPNSNTRYEQVFWLGEGTTNPDDIFETHATTTTAAPNSNPYTDPTWSGFTNGSPPTSNPAHSIDASQIPWGTVSIGDPAVVYDAHTSQYLQFYDAVEPQPATYDPDLDGDNDLDPRQDPDDDGASNPTKFQDNTKIGYAVAAKDSSTGLAVNSWTFPSSVPLFAASTLDDFGQPDTQGALAVFPAPDSFHTQSRYGVGMPSVVMGYYPTTDATHHAGDAVGGTIVMGVFAEWCGRKIWSADHHTVISSGQTDVIGQNFILTFSDNDLSSSTNLQNAVTNRVQIKFPDDPHQTRQLQDITYDPTYTAPDGTKGRWIVLAGYHDDNTNVLYNGNFGEAPLSDGLYVYVTNGPSLYTVTTSNGTTTYAQSPLTLITQIGTAITGQESNHNGGILRNTDGTAYIQNGSLTVMFGSGESQVDQHFIDANGNTYAPNTWDIHQATVQISTPSSPSGVTTIPTTKVLYRLHNTTADTYVLVDYSGKSSLTSLRDGNGNQVWFVDGSFNVMPSSVPGALAIQHLYNATTGDHLYTTNTDEATYDATNGWTWENQATAHQADVGYLFPADSIPAGGDEIFMLYRPSTSSTSPNDLHYYTPDPLTRDQMVQKPNTWEQQRSLGWTYLVPTLTSLSATSGAKAGGNTVTITGTHLTTAFSVYFGAVRASNVVVDPSGTSIAVVTPPQQNAGSVSVTVNAIGGTSVGLPFAYS